MLAEMEKNLGARGVGVPFHDETTPTLSELGISRGQSHRWQLEASVLGYSEGRSWFDKVHRF